MIGGRNKYLINGHVAQPRSVLFSALCSALRTAKQTGKTLRCSLSSLMLLCSRVQNLFHSIQLNVNNPHFLIMQGRITKVMKSFSLVNAQSHRVGLVFQSPTAGAM